MKCLINGTIVLKDRLMTESMIVFDDVIREIVPADATRTDLEYIDAKGRLISPSEIAVPKPPAPLRQKHLLQKS